MFEPTYTMSEGIVGALVSIAETKAIVDRARLLPKQELQLRRQALVRMTQSSTAIEGNTLTTQQVADVLANKKVDAPEREVHEVRNYLRAMRYLDELVEKKRAISEKSVLTIHKYVTQYTLDEDKVGKYRMGGVAVVRRGPGMSQRVMYQAPKQDKVPALMKDLISWLKESGRDEVNPIIVAGIAHQELAAIHPFADGNGRTARALSTLILYQRGYGFKHRFALEDYYNKDRQAYYKAINIGKTYTGQDRDVTNWLEYFVTGVREEVDDLRERILTIPVKEGKSAHQIVLTSEQVKLVDFAGNVGRITSSDVVGILNVANRTARRQLARLVEMEVLKAVGEKKARYYELA